jgi:hypothetical protein
MDAPIFDERDEALIRWFAEKYRNHDEQVGYDTFCEHLKLPRAECSKMRRRMLRAGLIAEGESYQTSIIILPECVEVVNQWDNPPLPDYWDKATRWLRSKPWSLPLFIAVVMLPLVKGYWDLITLILGCIYPASGH